MHFRHFNLVTESFPDTGGEINQMDLILCRNVFIYLDAGMVTQIADKMTATLVEGGYLMTGHGELYAHHLGGLRSRVFPDSNVYQKAQTCQLPQSLNLKQTRHLNEKSTELSNKAAATSYTLPSAQPKFPIYAVEQAATQVSIQDAWAYANQGQPKQARVAARN